jgi:ParB family chromosome partitioning protein
LRPVAEIVVNGHFRKDPGDLDSLCASIERHGLIQPVVTDPTGKLLAGWRRLEAHKLLGRTDIRTVTLNTDDPLGVQIDENTQRKDLTPSEKVAIARVVEEIEAKRAKDRQREAGKTRGRGKKGSGKFP